MVHLVDVLPTVADYLGVRPPPVDGVSLFRPDRRPYVICGTTGEDQPDFCARTARWKLRHFGPEGAAVEELYDLEADPDERHPLVPSAFPGVAKLLRRLLYPELP
jgi:arylsulfatase A-like enzyme